MTVHLWLWPVWGFSLWKERFSHLSSYGELWAALRGSKPDKYLVRTSSPRCYALMLLIKSVVLTCPVRPSVPDTTALSWLDPLGRGADFVFRCISSNRFSYSFRRLAVKTNNKSFWKFAPPDGMKIHFIMSVFIQPPAFISQAGLGD